MADLAVSVYSGDLADLENTENLNKNEYASIDYYEDSDWSNKQNISNLIKSLMPWDDIQNKCQKFFKNFTLCTFYQIITKILDKKNKKKELNKPINEIYSST